MNLEGHLVVKVSCTQGQLLTFRSKTKTRRGLQNARVYGCL